MRALIKYVMCAWDCEVAWRRCHDPILYTSFYFLNRFQYPLRLSIPFFSIVLQVGAYEGKRQGFKKVQVDGSSVHYRNLYTTLIDSTASSGPLLVAQYHCLSLLYMITSSI
jgi:hypothetical protein